MKNYKIHNSIAGFVISTALALATFPAAYADDIDIYLQTPPESPATPLVILTLDLNLDVTEIICSNVLAVPSSLPNTPDEDNSACELLQQVAVLPVLENTLGLEAGSLLDEVLGDESAIGGLLSLVGSIAGITVETLATELDKIVGPDGIPGANVALDRLDVVRLLLFRILEQLVGVKLGIVVSHANTCEAADFATPRSATEGCSNGAYFLLEPTELLEEDLPTITSTVLTRLGNIDVQLAAPRDETQPDPTPPFQAKEIYYEIFRSLTGGDVYNAPLDADDGLAATGTVSGAYTSPLDAAVCQNVNVINIMFTDPQQDDESDADILADPGLTGVDRNSDGTLTFPEFTQHLSEDGFTHGGVVYKVRSQFLVNGIDGGGPASLLSNLVGTTATLPLALNPLGLPFVTKENFQPVNTASASFGGPQPVFSGGNLLESGDNLYLGMFKPDANRKPAWRGNVKKLQLAEQNGLLTTVDALGRPAIGLDGNIRPEALTFWTVAADLPELIEGEIAGRDGKSTDLGGAGSLLIAPRTIPTQNNPSASGTGSDTGVPAGPRMFYQTASAAGTLSFAKFELNNTTVSEAGPALDGDVATDLGLIAWSRGYDIPPGFRNDDGILLFLRDFVSGLVEAALNLLEGVVDLVVTLLTCAANPFVDCPVATDPLPRAWAMGDVLHSHPLAIDYGNDDIRIFAGSNLGFLHQFRDTALASEATSFDGQEVWRLAPRALLSNFDEWQSEQPTASSRPYGVDGAPVAWIKDSDGVITAADGDHVKLFFGLRRGGKGYYAINATSPDAAPTGMWNINKTSGGDFDELGLTFSTPQIGRIRTLDGSGNSVFQTVLVFGGGYNGGYTSAGTALGKDATKGSNGDIGTNDTEGNAIFIVNADTGALIWKARKGSAPLSSTVAGKTVWEHPDFEDGIASDITALDTTGDGLLNRLYVGDTGGRVWRADIGSADITEWKAAPIANLGRHVTNTVAEDRRFFERPDVIRVSQGGTGFFTLVMGSGNRADPLNRSTDNQLFVIKDSGLLDATASATPTTLADLEPFTNNCATAGTCLSLLNEAQVASGWHIPLGPAGDIDRQGEKVLSSPITIGGQVLFTSYIPPSTAVNACTPQVGSGRLYAIDLLTGKGVIDLFAQDGESGDNIDYARGTPMAAAGIPAGVRYIRPETFLGSDFSLTNVAHQTSWRTYWRESDGER